MQFLCIGVNGNAEDVKQYISNELLQLKNKDIDYSINEVDTEGLTSIIFSIDDDKYYREKSPESYKILKTYISSALADYIIRKYEDKLLARIINTNYCYFNSSERKEILKKTLGVMRSDDKNIFNSILRIRRKNAITRRLVDYFENSNNIILDGFVNFRLKEYMKDLEEVVDKGVDDFLMDREYREFIRLLRYFVDVQEPKLNVVHIVSESGNRYILLDENKKEITNDCIQEYINEIAEGEINYDDLLVSSLITFAPRRIIIHCKDSFHNKELLETIKNVFFGRVSFCKKCDICTPVLSNWQLSCVKSDNRDGGVH